ncbi:MAG: HDOD domain-containing protein [Gammaproteobacteria bacterium]|nr:HDOD domain-containing protein [Gammaproteobacteria bacterium]
MSAKAEKFFIELKKAVETDRLVLPTLPEVALKIRSAVEDENASAQKIADTLTQDASLSARLIQVVNSPLYRARNPIDNLQAAVTRMGIRLVRDLVVSLAMKQIYQATSDVLDDSFRKSWNDSVEVAAISRMLSTTVPGLNPEQALLAGLVHNIGSLPILVMAEDDDELFQDRDALADIIWELQGRVGALILTSWNFPEAMIEVVRESHNFNYNRPGSTPAYVDLVQVALLQGNNVPAKYLPKDLSKVPAFAKMGMDAEVNVIEIEANQQIIENTKATLAF